jgi:ABC-2 type transport system ATP-binding protein
MGKTIFISSHILSELAELCDSVTIIDRGQAKYSGPMDALLSQDGETRSYLVTFSELAEGSSERIGRMPGVTACAEIDDKPQVRMTIDLGQADTNAVLRHVMELGLTVISFVPEQKHLNQAFMDLTTRGVR